MLEYAWWFFIVVGVLAIVVRWRLKERWRMQAWQLAALAVLANAGWYTLQVGGDHFEYRIFAHLVPLSWLALLGILGSMRASVRTTAATLAAQLALSLPIPWTHWALSQELRTYMETRELSLPVAPHLPRVLRPCTAAFDELQTWLHSHLVCIRHQAHAVFLKHEVAMLPRRPPTEEVVAAWSDPRDIAVTTTGAAGAIGWALPHVAIIDVLGLNDAVVARNPELSPGRKMTQERHPPSGYVECFRPNARVRHGELIIAARELPLGPAEVEECERRWWERMGIGR